MSPADASAASEAELKRTLPGRLALFARTRGARPALRRKKLGIWQEISWADYNRNVHATACALFELGVRPGDQVAILSDNRPEWLYADLATQLLSARSVGIYQTSPAADVAYLLNHSRARVLFCADQEQVDKVIEIGNAAPQLERVIVLDPRGTRGYADPRLLGWDELLAQGRRRLEAEPELGDARLRALDPKQPSMVIYGPGTTGQPKGALLSSANVCESIEQVAQLLGASDRDLVLSYLPLCHVAERLYSVFLPLATGLVVHFGESVDTVQEDLREVSPTLFLGVPRIWEKMFAATMMRMQSSSWLKKTLFFLFLRQGQRIAAARRGGVAGALDALTWLAADLLVFRALQEQLGLRRCRLPGSSAAPLAPELLSWFRGVGIPIHESYGMTELATGSHFNPPGRHRIGTVGQPLAGIEHRIAADGEILLRGPGVFHGYLHDEAATRAAFDEERFLRTGDIGEIDEQGFLRVTGRKQDALLEAGGKRLSPDKIENALKTSPFIREALALASPGGVVVALVQVEHETVADWARRRSLAHGSYQELAAAAEVVELIAAEVEHCNRLLAEAEQVRRFRILPRELQHHDGELTATQKLRRRVIADKWRSLIEAMHEERA